MEHKNIIGKVFYTFTDNFDVYGFVVTKAYKKNSLILETEVLDEYKNSGNLNSLHDLYLKTIYVEKDILEKKTIYKTKNEAINQALLCLNLDIVGAIKILENLQNKEKKLNESR